MKTKNGAGENLFSPAPLFFVFPDASHPAGGILPPSPWLSMVSPSYSGKNICRKV